MTLLSGNTYGGTVWSDTRRIYPMLPEVSPIQKCPHCSKYYFIEQAKSRHGDNSFCLECGKLSFEELLDAREQMKSLTLAPMQRWVLNHQILMAFNDSYHRAPNENTHVPPVYKLLIHKVINELLEGIDSSPDYDLFHAELLREIGRFDESREILLKHTCPQDDWVVKAMLSNIEQNNQHPFLLIEDGKPVCE